MIAVITRALGRTWLRLFGWRIEGGLDRPKCVLIAAPHTSSGRELIAHEVAHADQQLGAPMSGPLVVSMRPVPAELVATAVRVTARYQRIGMAIAIGALVWLIWPAVRRDVALIWDAVRRVRATASGLNI